MLDWAENLIKAREYSHKNGCILPSIREIVDRLDLASEIDAVSIDININPSKSDLVDSLLKIFDRLLQKNDLAKAIQLFLLPIKYLVDEPFYEQLYIWGNLTELQTLCDGLLQLLDSNPNADPEIFLLRINCLNILGNITFLKGDRQRSKESYTQSIDSISSQTLPQEFSDLMEVKSRIGLLQHSILLGDKIDLEQTGYLSRIESYNLSDRRFIVDRPYRLKLDVLATLGILSYIDGNYDLAIKYFHKKLKIATEKMDYRRQAEALSLLGYVYSIAEDFDNSLNHYFTALEIINIFDFPAIESSIMAGFGFIHYLQEQYRSSLYFYQKSLEIAKKIGLFIEKKESQEKVAILKYYLDPVREFSLTKIELEGIMAEFDKIPYPLGQVRLSNEIIQIHLNDRDRDIALARNVGKKIDRIIRTKIVRDFVKQHFLRLMEKIEERSTSAGASKTRNILELDLSEHPEIKDSVDLVIIVATDIELDAVRDCLEPYPERVNSFKIFEGTETYYVGKFGAFVAAITKCRMGSGGSGSSLSATLKAKKCMESSMYYYGGYCFW
jgi:tetratricopeptide (TPR) repeat protein